MTWAYKGPTPRNSPSLSPATWLRRCGPQAEWQSYGYDSRAGKPLGF